MDVFPIVDLLFGTAMGKSSSDPNQFITKNGNNFVAWSSMGNRGTSQHCLHTVPTTIEPLTCSTFCDQITR